MKKFIETKSTYAVISLFFAVYLSLFDEMRYRFMGGELAGLTKNDFTVTNVGKILVLAALIFVALIILDKFKVIFKFIEKYRYIIGLIIIVLCTIFELSGSSIGLFNHYLGYDYNTNENILAQGTLIGVPRIVRGDEYATFTPMNFSQYYNDYRPVTELLRGTPTDVTTFYGNPAFAPVTLFRPFLWGYILFGSAKGLAFYWSSRLVVLFLVSYELGKILTHRDKMLSATYAVLITFSQTIQWWYSINGLMEMFIFGQLAIVLLYELLQLRSTWRMIVVGLGLILCAGGYVFAYYPAQQIPLGYIFVVLAIYVLLTNRKLIRKKQVIFLVLAIVLSLVVVAAILYGSIDTIRLTMDTVYPGKRKYNDGGVSYFHLFYYIISIFGAVDEWDMITSQSILDTVCETSVFYSLFPVGICCGIYSMIRRRKADFLNIALIVIEIFFIVYMVWGLPDTVAAVTLMDRSLPQRVLSIMGFIDIILLLRFLSDKEQAKSKILPAIFAAIWVAIGFVIIYTSGYKLPILIWVMSFVVIIWIAYLLVRNDDSHKRSLVVLLICIITLTGITVNPLQKGADMILKDDMFLKIREIAEGEPDALWIVVGERGQLYNLPAMAGAKTINSMNTYPNLELWHRLDPGKEYEWIYNRYAHIMMDVVDGDTHFGIGSPDQIGVNVNTRDIDTLNVSYIMTTRKLDQFGYKCIYQARDVYIYKVT